MRTKSRILITTALVIGLIGSGSAAFAWWSSSTSTGSGTATTSTTSSGTITVNQNTWSGTLTPGSTVPISGTFSNSAAAAATIKVVTVTLASVAQTTAAASAYPNGCTTADYALVQPANQTTPFATQSITGGGTPNGTWTAGVTMLNSGSNQNGCLGATLTFNYSVS